jgi:hypothetical protein
MGFSGFKLVFRSVFVICLSMPEVYAQSSREIVTQPTEWFVLNSNIKLHKKFGFAFDGQLRFVQAFENGQHFFRNGLEVYLTPKLSVIPIGYMYVWNFQYGKQPATYANNEHRIWQQVLYKHNYGRLYFSHRFRIEQRFLEKRYTESNGTIVYEGYDTYLNRIRYRLQVQIPLNKEKIEPGAWFFAAFDELFYSWGSTVTYDKPDQNRLYAAIGYQFTKKLSLQGGGFYQMLVKKNGAQQENNVGTLIQVGYNLDFSRSEN